MIRFLKVLLRALEIIQNPDGSYSSRRFAGVLLIGCAVHGYFTGKDPMSTIAFLTTGGGLLGLTTHDKQALPVPPETIRRGGE
jgi:hypothetical protein